MEQRYTVALIFLLLFSCAKEPILEDISTIIDTPVSVKWETLSERYSNINETTGYFKNQEYFTNYLSRTYIESVLNSYSNNNSTYRVFHKNSTITDFDGDGKADIIAFAQSFSADKPYAFYKGKFIFLSNYESNRNIQVFDTDLYFGHAKMEANNFLPSGGVEVLFYSHETKPNMFIENENYGGFSDRPPTSPTLLYYENGFKTMKVGVVGDSHSGTSGDIDNDGDIDFIQMPIPGEYNQEALYYSPSVSFNDGAGGFTSQELISDLNDKWYVTSYELFDVNKDGFLDLIAGWRIGDVKQYAFSVNPILMYGNGSGIFSLSNSTNLFESTLSSAGIQAGILGYAFTDYDGDDDIDIVLTTTREEPNGSFDDGTYYDNYHLLLFTNENGTYTDTTSKITNNSSNSVPNFYHLKTIDIDNDGDYDLVPDGWANWGTKYYSSNLFWLNNDGNFIQNN